jgi:uncharacterized protein YndB with AHSA1/START domain
MSETITLADTQKIVVDEVFPHTAETIWKALTTGPLMARWLMEPTGFAPVPGIRFTFKTAPAGAWDGTIHCEVLEAIQNSRLVITWKGGDEGNKGYGSLLDTIVSFTLETAEGGTRLRLVHSGFVLPKNDSAFEHMSAGWKVVLQKIGEVAAETAG